MGVLTDRAELDEVPASGDYIHVVDVSDTTGSLAGTSKKLTYANLVGAISIAGTNTQVQFNDSGSFGASANFTFNTATNTLAINGPITGTSFNGVALTTGGSSNAFLNGAGNYIGMGTGADNSVAVFDGVSANLLKDGGIDLNVLTAMTSTGLFTGGVLSAGGATGTFSISAGSGFTIDTSAFPTMTPSNLTISARTDVAITDIATQPVTYILISPADAVIQQSAFPTPDERRDNVFLGVVVHSDNVNVNAINNIPSIALDVTAQLDDLMLGLGFFNLDGNRISPNGANLSFDKSLGEGFKAGSNFDNDHKDPHTLTMAALTAATFRYRNQDSSEGSDVTVIDPTTYDLAGTTTAIPGSNNQATIQRIYVFPSNIIRVQRGQQIYSTISDATDAIGTESFVTETNIAENGLLLASLVVTKGCTDLSDDAEALVFIASRFGELGSVGSSATTSLQNAYNNSIANPEILTSAVGGGLTVRQGSGADTDIVLDIQNGAGTSTFEVDGEGHLVLVTADIVHTALTTDDHAVEIICDADGFGDIKALDVDYITGDIAAGDDEGVLLINIDESASTGGDVSALEVLTTTVGSAQVNGMLAGIGVNPIEQLSGTFGDVDSALVNAVDRTTEFNSTGSDIEFFSADNDTVTIGNAAKFEELEFILSTVASKNVLPTFEYSTGVGTWAAFTPVDGTNGMLNSGVIAWLDSDIPSWAVGTGTEYLIRITRTRNGSITAPIEDLVQLAEATQFYWDEDGNIVCNSVVETNPSTKLIDLHTDLWVQTRTQGSFSVPNSGDGTEVTPLTVTVTPAASGNKMLIKFYITGEFSNFSNVYNVSRDGTLLTDSTNGSNNRWAGIAADLYDAQHTSTPLAQVITIIDESTLGTASTYRLLVRSANSTAKTFYLNRAVSSTGSDGQEAGLSRTEIMEISA